MKVEAENEEFYIIVEDDDRFRRATVKWDGCVHYEEWVHVLGVDDMQREHYFHICDLPGHIAFLQALLAEGKKAFNKDWPEQI